MNPQLAEMLNALAQKMGTTVEYLWPKMVAHAQIEATVAMWVCIAMAVLSLALFVFCFYGCFKWDHDGGPVLGSVITGVVSVILCICSANYYADVKFPEAKVIKTLMGK